MLPKFAQKLSDAEANEGKQCILKCKIDCIPPPKVQWFKGGSEITKDPRVKVSRLAPIKASMYPFFSVGPITNSVIESSISNIPVAQNGSQFRYKFQFWLKWHVLFYFTSVPSKWKNPKSSTFLVFLWLFKANKKDKIFCKFVPFRNMTLLYHCQRISLDFAHGWA